MPFNGCIKTRQRFNSPQILERADKQVVFSVRFLGNSVKFNFGRSQDETKCADNVDMDNVILSILSITLFCFCCHFFIKAIVSPIPLLSSEREFAYVAMQVGKLYKVTAWGLMTVVFVFAVAYSFYQVFSSL